MSHFDIVKAKKII